MSFTVPPKIAMINSFAGYGHCSTTEAIPVISAMKAQVCPVPTSILSSHLGLPSVYMEDFTKQMKAYLESWMSQKYAFDGVYCGFLGNPAQIHTVEAFIRFQKSMNCKHVLVDPVMGDHGKTYRTVTEEYVPALRALVGSADIITPNVTEGCLLADVPYREKGWSDSSLKDLSARLHSLGPEKIVITGIEDQPGTFLNYISIRNSNNITSYREVFPTAGPSRHGTGDIFAAILSGGSVKGMDFKESVHLAGYFISTCIQASEALGIPETEGVCLENFLSLLIPKDG